MKGSLTKRGKRSWRIKYDVPRDGGARQIRYCTVRGTRRDAEQKLAELVASVGTGTHIEANKITVGELVRERIDVWEAAGEVSLRVAARYRELFENQIAPHLGSKLVQRLHTRDIEQWHLTLRTSGRVGGGPLASRTVLHAHRVLSKALKDAARHDVVHRNVASVQGSPGVPDDEIVIAQDVPGLVAKLRGNRFYPLVIVALFTGMRLGEILALRRNRVDLDRRVAQVREALSYNRAHAFRFKVPKTKAGRRDVTLPEIVVETLREHIKGLLETRMALRLGRLSDDALLFTDLDGGPLTPNSVSAMWGDLAKRLGIPEVSFHALRHTHASQLIDANVDIVTISKRLGHAKPDITLRIYAHLFRKDDGKAAAAINASLKA
jgi:integrase